MSRLLAHISLRQRPIGGRKCLPRVFLAAALEPATKPLSCDEYNLRPSLLFFCHHSSATSRYARGCSPLLQYATTIHDKYDHFGSVIYKDIRQLHTDSFVGDAKGEPSRATDIEMGTRSNSNMGMKALNKQIQDIEKQIEKVSALLKTLKEPETVEALTMREALGWIRDKGWRTGIVETDCLNVVLAISSSEPILAPIGGIIDDCKIILQDSPGFRVGHVRRDDNKVAHELACNAQDWMEGNNDGDRWMAHSSRWMAHLSRDARDFYTERIDIGDNWPMWPEGIVKNFDWRDPEHNGVLPPVRTQIGGTCTYCAVCDLLSTNYKIATGKFRKFSIQWLIDGVKPFPKREAGMSDERYQELVNTKVPTSCGAIFRFIEEKGIVLEDDYKTTPGKRKPLEPISHPHKKYTLSRHGRIANGDMRHLLEEITRGPVCAGLQADRDFLKLKAGEVYMGNDKADRFIIKNGNITYPHLGLHAVLLTGFREQRGISSIVVRNSHGEEWSEGGYGYIHRTIPSLLFQAYYGHLEPLEDDEDEPLEDDKLDPS